MTLPADEDTRLLVRSLMEVIQRAKFYKTCLTCTHFNDDTEVCALAEGQRPPARVIVNACPAYTEEVPF
jgi:hypothetical protein